MANFPLVVSYYTKDTLYQLEVQNLIASCEQWQLEHHVEPIASFGSWERNCAFKPFFLFKMLEQFNRPIFWVDADAVFKKAPEHLDVFAHDFAVRINHDFEDSHPSKVISGSLYVNATEGAKRILKSWAKECLDSLSDGKEQSKCGTKLPSATCSPAGFRRHLTVPSLTATWQSWAMPSTKNKSPT